MYLVYMNCRLCSKLYKGKNFYCILVVFCYETNLAYFRPVWHNLKHNLAYVVFVDLATLP